MIRSESEAELFSSIIHHVTTILLRAHSYYPGPH